MELKTMQEIKDFVAQKNGFKTWAHYVADKEFLYCSGVDDTINEFSKLYALQIADAACKEQRESCSQVLPEGTSPRIANRILDAPQPDIDKLLK